MGKLMIAHAAKAGTVSENGRYYEPYYKNKYAVANVIHDITRTRENELYWKDLIGTGAFGVGMNLTADEQIREFLFVQNAYNIENRGGRRMHHEIFLLSDEEAARLYYRSDLMWWFAAECASFYFRQGYQVVFAVHHQGKFHVHFAVNSINYKNGNKYHTSNSELEAREYFFHQLLQKYQLIAGVPVTPIEFYPAQTAVGVR